MREVVEPVANDIGHEHHPAWVLLGASRVSASPPGRVLFDSDIRHQHYVIVRLRRASRKRDLHSDYKHGREELFEVAMSEAQWASFVSSMNTGDGVPATLLFDRTQDDPEVPGMPYAPRLQESMNEVHGAADRMAEKVREAFDAYKEHKTAANLRNLEIVIGNMTPNIDFAALCLNEHAENVVQRARADIEAFVYGKARQLGLEPGDLGGLPMLESGQPEE